MESKETKGGTTGANMRSGITKEEFLEHVRQSLQANFQLEEKGVEGTLSCDLIARYFNVSGRIFITPQDVIDRMETFERVYVKCFDRIDCRQVQAFFDRLCEMVSELKPGKDHFQTDITGIIVCGSVPQEVARQVKKLKYDRTFRFYFRGWCEIRMVCVELSSGKVYTNPPGKELKKVYTIKQRK